MFRFWASSTCLFSIPVCPYRRSRVTLQHIFSLLAGAQFADFITCLAIYHFVFSLCIQLPFSQFTCFNYTHFLVSTCPIMFRFWALSIYLFPNPVCPHRGSAEPFTNAFCFGLYTLSLFRQFTYYMLLILDNFCTCFVPMFSSFAISPPQ